MKKSPLYQAIENNDIEKIEKLVKEGEALHTSKPLILAIQKNNFDIVKLLVENGVDINARDSYGQTPLMYAAAKNYCHILKYLLAHNAEINLKTPEGVTALKCAVHNKHLAAIRILLDYGADTANEEITIPEKNASTSNDSFYLYKKGFYWYNPKLELNEFNFLIHEQKMDMLNDNAPLCPKCKKLRLIADYDQLSKYAHIYTYKYKCNECQHIEYIHEEKFCRPKLEFIPENEEEFKNLLIRNRKAKRSFYDKNGNLVKQTIWKIRSFSQKSSLRGNIEQSEYFQKAIDKEISKIKFEIIYDD